MSEAVADQSNPFEEFNKAMGAGIVTDPYPDFAPMRAEGISKADVRQLLGLDADADLGFDPADVPPLFTVSSYDAVQEVLRDNVRFSSSGYAEVMGAVMGHTILEMDEPEHHAYRSVIQQAFSRKAMEAWETELVGPIVDELIDGFVDDGRADLVSQLLFPFPVNVIAGLLGLPRADLPQFHRWTVELISVSIDMDKALNASKSLYDYLVGYVHERRETPGNDMISVLAHADHEGQQLTDDEIIAFCRLLLPAGRGDHVPLVVEPDDRAAHPSRSARRGAQRSLAVAASDRGGTAVGAAAAHDHAHRDGGHVGVRGRPPGGGDARRQHGRGQPRRAPVGRRRRVQHLPAADGACRLRVRARTCASACTWPAWRPRSRSTASSTGCRTSASTPTPTRRTSPA